MTAPKVPALTATSSGVPKLVANPADEAGNAKAGKDGAGKDNAGKDVDKKAKGAAAAADGTETGAEVVSLDSFRKKN